MDRKYFDVDQEFVNYKIASADGTFETILTIQQVLVDEIKEIVKVLEDNIADKYVDLSLNTFIMVSLINGVEYFQSNNNIEKIIGDSHGN